MKRLLDIIISTAALIVLSPLFLVVAIIIKLESPGPVIYKSKRAGKNYKVFDFYKFRTMVVGQDENTFLVDLPNQYALEHSGHKKYDGKIPYEVDQIGAIIAQEDDILYNDKYYISESDFNDEEISREEIVFIKVENDPRITKSGRVLRKFSIDELPQLVNILKGDMSLVGNRPLPLYEAEGLTTDANVERFLAPAGLTGLWQVSKRGDNGSMSSEERRNLDVKYAREHNLLWDIKLFFATFVNFIQKGNV